MLDNKITGSMIYYYYVCKKKLWLSLKGISMESENDNVKIGKFLDETSYAKERKHICINNEINMDFIERTGTIHEIKKSRSIEEASIMQVKYYMFYLKGLGVQVKDAKIDYPLLKKVVAVELNEADEKLLAEIIEEIQAIGALDKSPPIISDKRCKKCAYHDLCYV